MKYDIINGNLSKSTALYFLVICVPIAVVLELTYPEPVLVFIFAAIGLIPLAKLIGESTEQLATHYGPTLASLLNVTFGNAAEIIIGIVAMSAGLLNLVKASIIGSIIGNILLVFGLSLFVGYSCSWIFLYTLKWAFSQYAVCGFQKFILAHLNMSFSCRKRMIHNLLRTIEGESNCDGRQIIIVNHENAFIGCVP